jgi:hypothetical protein
VSKLPTHGRCQDAENVVIGNLHLDKEMGESPSSCNDENFQKANNEEIQIEERVRYEKYGTIGHPSGVKRGRRRSRIKRHAPSITYI